MRWAKPASGSAGGTAADHRRRAGHRIMVCRYADVGIHSGLAAPSGELARLHGDRVSWKLVHSGRHSARTRRGRLRARLTWTPGTTTDGCWNPVPS